MKPGRLNIVLDGQFGSTGKGKLCYYLALKHDVQVAVCDFQTNAGHTIYDEKGKKYVFQQLPVSALKEDVLCLINPGATITISKLLEEIEMVGCQNRLIIHPHACIVTDECKQMEAEMLKRIASTLKGVGAALGMKAMRHPKTVLAKDCPELARWIGDTTESLNSMIIEGRMVLGEAAQGFDLSLNHGYEYPYVTSRDINTASFLSNAGVPPVFLGSVYGCLRTYPIRVGNHVEDGKTLGTSGPHYPDQEEISWERLKFSSGAKKDLEERTTVTQKVRRVFTFSKEQIRRFIQVCYPDYIFLNFVNHLDASAEGVTDVRSLPKKVTEFTSDLQEFLNENRGFYSKLIQIKYLGTGPLNNEMVEL